MQKALIILVAASVAACSAGRTATWKQQPTATAGADSGVSASAVSRGDEAWEKRDERASLEQAIAAWEEAVAADPENPALLVRLARGYYLLADGHLRGDKEAYLAKFERGVDYAERALTASSPGFKAKVVAGERVQYAVSEVGPEGVPALYWYSSNLGKWAKAKGFTTTLAQKDTIKAVMERCLALDPTFYYGGPDRYFGGYYAVAPSFAGGDLNKSEEHFRKSLELAPNYLATKVLWAELLATKRQDKATYKRLLEEVLAAPDEIIPELTPESRIEKVKAQELLSKIEDNF